MLRLLDFVLGSDSCVSMCDEPSAWKTGYSLRERRTWRISDWKSTSDYLRARISPSRKPSVTAKRVGSPNGCPSAAQAALRASSADHVALALGPLVFKDTFGIDFAG